MQLRLDRQTWTYDAPLNADPSGFGSVYLVKSETGETAVAKAVPKEPGAQREFLMADSLSAAGHHNVIPILDSGEHEDSWILVMPRADHSLAQFLAANELPLTPPEVVSILRDIAKALAEIDGQVVHRDIKPANILFHEGKWKLADFGIARYAQASTSGATRKRSFTYQYAAPEQWEYGTATGATDVYAFGVLAYELLTGQLPFPGPNFREQHLGSPPPPSAGGPKRLSVLIDECLYKDADVRPKPKAILKRLADVENEQARPGPSALAAVDHRLTQEQARQQAQVSAERDRLKKQARKFEAAAQAFDSIATPLREEIEGFAQRAEFQNIVGSDAPKLRVDFGQATLTLNCVRPFDSDGWNGPFTVIAYSAISVDFGRPGHHDWNGRSHSLWFCDAHEEGTYAWYELAFMDVLSARGNSRAEPYHCSPREAEVALSNVISSKQVAWPVTEIDRADPSEFIDRWLKWFAEAAELRLRRPGQMPEKPCTGTWRRS
ncbi:serine/threonine-protein kinase [Citricoccus nitrophenolicus]|uniref:serine/threonine-protein kinase n=1 Tax=Citricoccus nitrophenolicus TaxID=863575 RepID=UPI0039B6DDB3